MNTNNVYIGQYKNSSYESLFYKREMDRYEDLKREKRIVSASEIDLNSLVAYREIFPNQKKDQMRNHIIRVYDMDRREKIELNKVFIGDIYQVSKIVDQRPIHNIFQINLEGIMIKPRALLLDEGEFLTDMERPFKIKRWASPEVGKLIVIENNLTVLTSSSNSKTEKLQPFTKVFSMTEKQATKRKILERYRGKYEST